MDNIIDKGPTTIFYHHSIPIMKNHQYQYNHNDIIETIYIHMVYRIIQLSPEVLRQGYGISDKVI